MKRTFLAILAIVMLTLSACAGQSAASTTAGTGAAAPADAQNQQPGQPPDQGQQPPQAAQVTPTPYTVTTANGSLDTTYTNALSVPLQLLYGSFKLSGATAITKAQAASLIPLWTSFKTLASSAMPGQPGQNTQAKTTPTPSTTASSSDTQAKIDELAKQIMAILTADQIKAIGAMKLTQESAQAILKEQGITTGGPQASGTPQAGGAGGQPPQGGGPGGGQGQGTPPAGGSGGGNPPSGGSGGSAPSGAPGGQMPGQSNMVPPEVIKALLKYLANITGDASILSTVQASAGQPNQ